MPRDGYDHFSLSIRLLIKSRILGQTKKFQSMRNNDL